MRVQFQLFWAFAGVATIGFGQRTVTADRIPVLTVCDALKDASKYNGKSIFVVGRQVSTMEGLWLGQKCKENVVADGRKWDSDIWTQHAGLKMAPAPILPAGTHWDDKMFLDALKGTESYNQT
jgi:hypothetical protein